MKKRQVYLLIIGLLVIALTFVFLIYKKVNTNLDQKQNELVKEVIDEKALNDSALNAISNSDSLTDEQKANELSKAAGSALDDLDKELNK